MAINVLHKNEQGNGLEFEGGKLSVKPDNSGNVKFEVSAQGVKGTVELPPAFDPAELNQKIEQAKTTADGAQAQATLANEKNGSQDTEIEQLKAKNQELEQALNAEKAKVATLEGKVQALETREDIHVTNAEVVEDTKLKLNIQGSEAVTVDLAKFLNVVPTAQEVYEQIKADILRDVKAELQGEEIQDFSGSRKGYLLKA